MTWFSPGQDIELTERFANCLERRVTPASGPSIATSSVTRAYVRLIGEWRRSGKFAGLSFF